MVPLSADLKVIEEGLDILEASLRKRQPKTSKSINCIVGDSMKIKAAVLRQSGLPRPYTESKPLSIEEVDLDPPKSNEVMIKVKAVGLCHSDLVAIGERGKPMPIVLGHEAAGIITEIGDNVEGFEIGDHVVPSYVASCGLCEMCSSADQPSANLLQLQMRKQF